MNKLIKSVVAFVKKIVKSPNLHDPALYPQAKAAHQWAWRFTK